MTPKRVRPDGSGTRRYRLGRPPRYHPGATRSDPVGAAVEPRRTAGFGPTRPGDVRSTDESFYPGGPSIRQ